MKIHKEGSGTIAISTFIAAAIILITVLLVMPAYPILGWVTVLAILGLLVFILSFFSHTGPRLSCGRRSDSGALRTAR